MEVGSMEEVYEERKPEGVDTVEVRSWEGDGGVLRVETGPEH